MTDTTKTYRNKVVQNIMSYNFVSIKVCRKLPVFRIIEENVTVTVGLSNCDGFVPQSLNTICGQTITDMKKSA